jgi:hypothetical protein
MKIVINIYFKTTNDLIKSECISSSKIKNIDDARLAVVKYLGKHYSNCKYKLSILTTFEQKVFINIIFEDDVSLSRDIKLKKLLDD